MLPGVTSSKFVVENFKKLIFQSKKSLENQSKKFLCGGSAGEAKICIYFYLQLYDVYHDIVHLYQFCVAFCHSVKAEC